MQREILDKEGLLSLENLTGIWKLHLQREILVKEGLLSFENLTGEKNLKTTIVKWNSG